MRKLVCAIAAAMFATGAADAADYTVRIALDTPPSHIRNVTVERFIEEVENRIPGVIEFEVMHSAQAGRDRDLPRSMRQGAVDMAIPGNMLLDVYEPNTALNQIPAFYGLEADAVHAVLDGEVGAEINRRVEDAINVVVIGKWLDLGPQHTFGTERRPILSYDDMAGAKIRHSGGAPNNFRFAEFEAIPEVIPFSDVPLALTQGRIDGVQTSFESAYRTKLFDAGLRTAFKDAQWFGMYIPIVSRPFWERLPDEARQAIRDAWEVAVQEERIAAAEAQDEAEAALGELGMTIITPAPEEIREKRELMIGKQDQLVEELGLDPDLVTLSVETVRSLP